MKKANLSRAQRKKKLVFLNPGKNADEYGQLASYKIIFTTCRLFRFIKTCSFQQILTDSVLRFLRRYQQIISIRCLMNKISCLLSYTNLESKLSLIPISYNYGGIKFQCKKFSKKIYYVMAYARNSNFSAFPNQSKLSFDLSFNT